MFSERLRTRSRVWWGKPNKWRNRESYRHLLHRLKENHTLRRQDDPDERWYCCDLWQRTLSNKWNAREFVQKHGGRVPQLYWHGRRASRLPIGTLPDRFVIRPIFGDSCRGTYVIETDRDLLTGTRYTKPSLKAHLQQTRGWLARFPLLAEEFVRTEAGEYQLPVEYKCYTFGEIVGAIQVVQRLGAHEARHRFYTPSWTPFDDPMNTHNALDALKDPPRCLDEIVHCAQRLGVQYGTFVRVDLYATDKGCVFGELSSTPGSGRAFTAFADAYFEDLWQKTFPDKT